MGFKISKLLFPHLARDQRRKRMRTIVASVLICAAIIGFMLVLLVYVGRTR